ncbi:hypothetical protein VUR80DRAFT_7864 [Thermomyces stellatus]
MSTPPEISYDENGRKTLCPLENNPEVLEALSRRLGLSLPDGLGFHDVISVDDPELMAWVPGPVHALLCTVPAPVNRRVREADPALAYDGAGPDEPVTWFRQTFGNVCGLIALLHAVANSRALEFVPEGSELRRLLADAEPLRPAERAQLLYDSEFLEAAHRDVARQGQSANTGSAEATSNHFIAFVKGKDGHLWELEGVAGGPIDRGQLAEGEDVFSERALEAGIKRFLRAAAEDDRDFSIVALAGEPAPIPEALG